MVKVRKEGHSKDYVELYFYHVRPFGENRERAMIGSDLFIKIRPYMTWQQIFDEEKNLTRWQIRWRRFRELLRKELW